MNIFKDTAAFLLLLSILAFSAVYYHEFGYCKYFKIPSEYISIELSKYGHLIFIFLTAFAFFSYFFDSFTGHILLFSKIKNKKARIAALIFFLALTIYLFKDYFKFLLINEVFALLATMIFGFGLWINKDGKDTSPTIIESQYSIVKQVAERAGKFIGPILVFASLACLIMFCKGYFSAKLQVSFATKPNNKEVLLKKYDDVSIYGILQNGFVKEILIENNVSSIDSLHWADIR